MSRLRRPDDDVYAHYCDGNAPRVQQKGPDKFQQVTTEMNAMKEKITDFMDRHEPFLRLKESKIYQRIGAVETHFEPYLYFEADAKCTLTDLLTHYYGEDVVNSWDDTTLKSRRANMVFDFTELYDILPAKADPVLGKPQWYPTNSDKGIRGIGLRQKQQ